MVGSIGSVHTDNSLLQLVISNAQKAMADDEARAQKAEDQLNPEKANQN